MTAPHITAIRLGVRDVAASRRFYVDGLGFEEIPTASDDIAFVRAGHGLLLALWDATQLPSEYGDVGHGPLAPPMSLGHNVAGPDEVQTWFERAISAGASSVSEPGEQVWGGVSACVADPDGFGWDFVHNPAFSVADDGAVTV